MGALTPIPNRSLNRNPIPTRRSRLGKREMMDEKRNETDRDIVSPDRQKKMKGNETGAG